MPLTNEQVQEVVARIYDVVARVHRLARVLGALLTVNLLLLGGFYIQQHNLADDQATTLAVDRRLEDILEQVDTNTAEVAMFARQIRAQQAAGPSPATLRLYAMVEEMARVLGVTVPDPPPSSGRPTTTTSATTTPG